MTGKFRSYSGLILFMFVICHFINHMFGLHSLEAMNAAHKYLVEPWRYPPVNILLIASAVIHMLLAFKSIFMRRSYRLAAWEWGQLISGIIIPFLLVEHILATMVAEKVFGATPNYRLVMSALWVGAPYKSVLQALALIIVWAHGCFGIHYWFRTKNGYEKWLPYLRYLAFTIPTLSLAGYMSAGYQTIELAKDENFIQSVLEEAMITMGMGERITNWTRTGWLIFVALVIAPLLHQAFGKMLRRLKNRPKIKHADGRTLAVENGASILETFRANNIALAAVCGGRGRCTTCRVQITDGLAGIGDAEEIEAKALARINAPEGLRLACQVRPSADISILPLLPADATASDGRRPGGLEGQEKHMSIMFIDLRGSTKLGEEKLPYDVLYILNRFFAEMTAALHETDGHYAQFNGDGLMALYGLNDATPKEGALKIIEGAKAMLRRLDDLNETLKSELKTPLKIGIGIHFGEAIVGTMGPPKSQLTTAIGDNINIAARLESLTKEYGKSIIISRSAANTAGIVIDNKNLHEVVVRGRDAPIHFFAVDNFN